MWIYDIKMCIRDNVIMLSSYHVDQLEGEKSTYLCNLSKSYKFEIEISMRTVRTTKSFQKLTMPWNIRLRQQHFHIMMSDQLPIAALLRDRDILVNDWPQSCEPFMHMCIWAVWESWRQTSLDSFCLWWTHVHSAAGEINMACCSSRSSSTMFICICMRSSLHISYGWRLRSRHPSVNVSLRDTHMCNLPHMYSHPHAWWIRMHAFYVNVAAWCCMCWRCNCRLDIQAHMQSLKGCKHVLQLAREALVSISNTASLSKLHVWRTEFFKDPMWISQPCSRLSEKHN